MAYNKGATFVTSRYQVDGETLDIQEALNEVIEDTAGMSGNVFYFDKWSPSKDGTEDNLEKFQSAVNEAEGGILVIGKGTYATSEWFLSQNVILWLSPETEIIAMPGQGEGSEILRIFDANVTIHANGATLRHDRVEYGDNGGESDHCLSIRGGVDTLVTITGTLNLRDAGGDGIYVRTEGSLYYDVIDSRNSYRNNFSAVTYTNCVGRHLNLIGANGTNPQAGIDIEPNSNDVMASMNFQLGSAYSSGNARRGLVVAMFFASNIGYYNVDIGPWVSYEDGTEGISVGWSDDGNGRIYIDRPTITRSGTSNLVFPVSPIAPNVDVTINQPKLVEGNVSDATSAEAQAAIAFSNETETPQGGVKIYNPIIRESRVSPPTYRAVVALSDTDLSDVTITDIDMVGIDVSEAVRFFGASNKEDIKVTFAPNQHRAFENTSGATTSENIGASHLGQVITNGSSTSPIIFTLEDIPLGDRTQAFKVTSPANMRIKPPSGKAFTPINAVDKYMQSAVVGASVVIEYDEQISDWRVVSRSEGWTDEV